MVASKEGSVSEPEPTITVLWTCGCYLHPWEPTGEPVECEAEFETEESVWDWEDSLCRVQCPSCGATLCQRDGYACTIV